MADKLEVVSKNNDMMCLHGCRKQVVFHNNKNSRYQLGSGNLYKFALERIHVRIIGSEASEGLGE